jgi:Thoeris protein ThsB, TIR-like domain
MAYYRNKLYVAFDGDEDMNYYNTLRMWRDNENIDFNFADAHDLNIARDSSLTESKERLRERMHNSKAMLMLVGARTKYIRGYIPWEIGFARYLDLPIIVANLNDKSRYDPYRCPSALEQGRGAIHISFEKNIIKYAIENWPEYHNSHMSEVLDDVWHYKDSTYTSLGL